MQRYQIAPRNCTGTSTGDQQTAIRLLPMSVVLPPAPDRPPGFRSSPRRTTWDQLPDFTLAHAPHVDWRFSIEFQSSARWTL